MRRSLVVAAAVVLPLLVAGCTPSAPEPPVGETSQESTPAPSSSTVEQVGAPTIVSPQDVAGTEVTVVVGGSVVIDVPDGTEAEWSGSTADPAVAEFSAGGPSEGAVFRPGFTPRAVGATAATLAGPDGQNVSFTISVVAP